MEEQAENKSRFDFNKAVKGLMDGMQKHNRQR